MMGSSDQILPFADCEVIFHPFAESLIVHSVYVFSHVIRCTICGDQFDSFDRNRRIQVRKLSSEVGFKQYG